MRFVFVFAASFSKNSSNKHFTILFLFHFGLFFRIMHFHCYRLRVPNLYSLFFAVMYDFYPPPPPKKVSHMPSIMYEHAHTWYKKQKRVPRPTTLHTNSGVLSSHIHSMHEYILCPSFAYHLTKSLLYFGCEWLLPWWWFFFSLLFPMLSKQ